MWKICRSSISGLLVLASTPAFAQRDGAPAASYPARPLRIIVPQSPGASTDLTARLVARALSEAWKQPVVVDNRPGAGTIIGTELVTRAAPDGHTLLVVASGITVNPSMHKRMPYDTGRDLAPISQLTRFSNLLAAHPGFPAKTLQDLLALAKAKPGTINYASAGLASGTHMSMELLKAMTGIDLVHIPYTGGGLAVTAAIGGQVQLNIGTTVGVLPHVRSGKLRAIAVTTAARSPAAPDVPTFAESGVAGYDHGPWNGLFAPAKTPPAILAKIHTEVARALQAPDVRKVFANEGVEAVASAPEAFAALVRTELATWAKVVKAAGIKAE
jgi:tripartite-type tricarboxylate transporter receptor subunit TctC